jgi:hypothetical protein
MASNNKENEVVLLLGLIACCIFPPAILFILLYSFIAMIGEAYEKKGWNKNK